MKRIHSRMASALALTVSLGACVMAPQAPMIPVAPGPNKSFDAFAADQATCQQYATAQTAPQAYAATNQAVGTALLTAALGAGLGAAVGGGGWHGSAGRGAGIGAASGAVVGTALGASQAGFAQMSLQQQYDVIYGQCMYAHGDQVAGFSPSPGTPLYPGGPGPAPYGGPGPSPYGGPGPSPYGGPPYPGAPVPPPA